MSCQIACVCVLYTLLIKGFLEYCDYIALILGIVGTLVWAHNGRWVKYAAPFWLVSSLLWMLFALHNDLTALGARDFISLLLYLYGWRRWLYSAKHK